MSHLVQSSTWGPMSFIGIFGKKFEEERLEAIMLDSFSSDLDSDAERIRRKLIRRAGDKPQETIVLLLRNYEGGDERVKRSIIETLAEMAGDRSMMTLILEQMVHPSRDVRKAVQGFLGDRLGPHAAIYASLYEQTMLMVAMSKRKDIPVEDLVSLAELTKETLMDGEVMESVRDIGFCLDHAKHRYRSSEQLKDYLSDFLKMAPDLSRMGVYSSSIEGPLRKAMKASRNRSFDETREIVEERRKEAELRRGLGSLIRGIKDDVTSRPVLDIEGSSDEDREELRTLRDLVESVDVLLNGGRRASAVVLLQEYIDGLLQRYEATLGPRLRGGDQGAAATVYIIGLTCVKMASYLMPLTAEKAYLEGLKDLEGAPSVQVVVLPAGITGG